MPFRAQDKALLEAIRYAGPDLRLMEICGSHTAAISKNGIRSLLGPNIHMISGPGCPVCVTVTAYIDKLIELSENKDTVILSFGDLLRVPGSNGSLQTAKARGADIRMVYSPIECVKLAQANPEMKFIFAAIGFETTAPVYAALIESALEAGLKNIRLLTSLKTMPGAVNYLLEKKSNIQGFIAPGHVCAVNGTHIFEELSRKYSVPFVAAGFSAEQVLMAIAALIRLNGQPRVLNLYGEAVTRQGNEKAVYAVHRYFEEGEAVWRGIGEIEASGLYLREEYSDFDAGSRGLIQDNSPDSCKCGEVIVGEIDSSDCPLFGTVCTPNNPIGACMVSEEGACFNRYLE